MARLGATALALERAEAKARRQAALEENLQLALWRMDSALAPLMAEESARPYFTYSPLYPAERAFTCMFAEIQKGDVLIPSPLLTFTSPQVRLHFQYGPDGRLSSPQVPAGNMRNLAEARYLRSEQVEQACRRLDELGRLVSREDLAQRSGRRAKRRRRPTPTAALAYGPDVAIRRSSNEYMMRSRSTRARPERSARRRRSPLSARSTVSQGPLQAVWIGPRAGPGASGPGRGGDVSPGVLARLGRDPPRPGGQRRRPRAQRERWNPSPRWAGQARRGCSPRCRCGWSPARSPTSRSRGGRLSGSRW